MTTRRQWLAAAGTAAVASMLPRGPQGAELDIKTSSQSLFRVRTITAGVTLGSLDDLSPIHAALTMLQQARTKFEQAGYEVQTLRIATNPVLASTDAAARRRALPALETLDKAVSARGVIVSIGPLLTEDRDDADLPSWCAELVQRTRSISFSVAVASGERGMHRQSCAAAAGVIIALSKALAGGVANFRFAAAANVPPGTPFFPVGYHDGDNSLAIGLESARVVQAAFAGATSAADAEQRLRTTLNEHLGGVDILARRFTTEVNLRYLGIDSSPAPGLDSSIGAAIETLTQVPFGSASTLTACATITSALKSLDVRTCGYSGLMLPVLEDPVLAQRAKEGRYGIEELLLYSSVCGTGLDVVPIPGDAAAPAVARLIGDVAALSAKLRKPLSARLFPAPGKKAGDLVAFDDPHLTETSVFPLDADK